MESQPNIGTTNNHRFLPTESPRQVAEAVDTHPTKLAGEIGFNPIATMQVENKNVYVRPVKNTSSRPLSPNVVGTTGKVTVHGERVIELGPDLHSQIRAKVNNVVSNLTNTTPNSNNAQKYINSSDTKSEPTKNLSMKANLPIANLNLGQNRKIEDIPPSNQQESSILKSQLEQINKILFDQVKQKVAAEIARQQKTPLPKHSEAENTLVKPVGSQPQQPTQIGIAKNNLQKPAEVKPLANLKLGFSKPVTADTKKISEAWIKSIITKPPKNKPIKESVSAFPNNEQLKNHIIKLEEEIKILIKEVENLDKSIKSLNSEKTSKELANLEYQIETDQKMLSAVGQWRLALNNLINSHTIALKYLKQKTDWLEQNRNHKELHEKRHQRPKEPVFDQNLLSKTDTEQLEKTDESSQTKNASAPSYVNAVHDLVNLALKMEKQLPKSEAKTPPEKPKETLQEKKPPDAKENQTQEVSTTKPAEPVKVQYVPFAKPTEVATPANNQPNIIVSTSDIERQILEQAEKEERVKESIRKEKEEKAKALAEAQSKNKESQTKTDGKPSPQNEVSEALLKSEFDKLKTSLTTLDNSNIKNLPSQQRSEMIHKLENLEKESVISKQYDEIKAVAERRRINQELSTMLHRLGEKPPEPTETVKKTQQKIETLKTQQKKQTTPAEKARLIAQIKELERQTQAKKAVNLSKPAVKAQLAFGKMLPNTPTIPNVINGIVKDNKGLLLSTVVIIVTDENDDPVRAFKTNKLGQFALSTPVPNGTYRLTLEKEGYDFDIIEVNVNGEILPPIEIKAK